MTDLDSELGMFLSRNSRCVWPCCEVINFSCSSITHYFSCSAMGRHGADRVSNDFMTPVPSETHIHMDCSFWLCAFCFDKHAHGQTRLALWLHLSVLSKKLLVKYLCGGIIDLFMVVHWISLAVVYRTYQRA